MANNRYPKLKVDFGGDGAATAAEFGRQRFYFADATREVVSFSVAEDAASGASLGSVNALSGTGSPTFSLTDNNFEIASGSINVKATAALDYETIQRTLLCCP